MTNQGARPYKLVVGSIALILIAVVVAIINVNIAERERKTNEAMILMDKGIAQFRQDQFEASLETLGSISEDVLENWHIPYYMGSALIKLKDFEPAAVQLEKALALNGNETNVLFALGVVYYKLGNLSLSKAYFAKVLEIEPGNEEARGLMDIMANLERQQPDAIKPTPESKPETDN